MAAISSIMIGTALVSGGVSAYGQYQAGKSQKAMSKYNAQIARQQAKAEAQSLSAKGKALARDQRELRGQQAMAVGATGGMIAGTDLLALADQASQMSLDQLELKRQQDIALAGGKSQAAMSLYEGRMAKYTSKFGATSSLLGSASDAYIIDKTK